MFSTTLQTMISAAEKAAVAIMTIYAEADFGEQQKGDGSPLTRADMAAHHAINAHLHGLNMPVLSEESAELPYAERQKWTRYFLVDPLDGTKEFIARNGEFTVNIALIENGKPIAGVVLAPALNVCYAAEIGLGSFKRDVSGQWQAIRCRQWSEGTALKLVASRRHGADKVEQVFKGFELDLKNRGSALKICLVAEGEADCYPRFGPTSEWDTAAGQAIVECAGGELTGLDLKSLRYNNKDSLLNPDFVVFGSQADAWRTRIDWLV